MAIDFPKFMKNRAQGRLYEVGNLENAMSCVDKPKDI